MKFGQEILLLALVLLTSVLVLEIVSHSSPGTLGY